MALFGFGNSKGSRREAESVSAPQGGPVLGGGNYVGDVVPIRRGQEALVVSAVYGAVDILSNSLAMMSIAYMKRDAKRDCFVQDDGPLYGEKLNYLLQVQPNRRQNAMQFWRNAWQNVYFRGNAIIWPVRDRDGEIVALEQAEKSTAVNYDLATNSYEIIDTVRGWQMTLDAREVIHLRNTYTDYEGIVGLSTIKYAARALSIVATGDKQTLENTSKGGRMKFIIMHPQKQSLGIGRYNSGQMQKATDKLNADIYSQDVSFLNVDGELKQVSMSAADQQLLQIRSWGVDEVARFFVVPKSMLGAEGGSSYKTPAAANVAFLNRSLAPRMRELEVELNAKLIGMGEKVHKISVTGDRLFVLDVDSQNARNKSRIETGLATVNELRKEANLPRVENGDDAYVSTNLAVAGSEKLSGASAAPAGTGTE